MAAHAQRLHLRLFLEGIEVPIVSAQLQCLPNAPILGALQLPPVPEGTRFLPRTLVHLFFRDPYEEVSPHLSTSMSTASDKKSPTEHAKLLTYNQGIGDEDTRYKSIFMGEVLGFEWTKDQASRGLVLQCADLSNYWDYAYQWTNTDLFGPGIKALFSGGSTNLFTDFLSSSGEVITNILRTPSITFPQLKGLAGGIVHLLESIGGSYYYDKKIAGQNIFFTLAELRLHINQMIMALEDDPTSARLLAVHGYSGMLSRLLGGMGGQTSIRQSISALQGVIFHETYAQPCPMYIPGSLNPATSSKRIRVQDDPSTMFAAAAANNVATELTGIKAELRMADQKPGLATILAKDKLSGTERSALSIRLSRQQTYLKGIVMQMGKLRPPAPKVYSQLVLAAQRVGTAGAALRGWHPNNEQSIVKVERPLNEAINALKAVATMTRDVPTKGKPMPPRLAQQILRPDVWFSAPPRCNVLFPEHYHRLNYRRSFMEEPTRLLLKTNDEFFGEDELFDRLYFAPKVASVKQAQANLQSMLQNDLLNHELFTGILPVFEKMGEFNIFAAKGGVVNGRVPHVGLAQRSANFLYFKYRFAARQMTVSGRFNPYVAVGFPGLVIDKYVDIETLKRHNTLLAQAGMPTRDINTLLGTSFLGNFTQVTFALSQTQGSTDIVMSYPRQPEERVEFLGASELSASTISKRFGSDVIRATDVASIGQPSIDSLGPNLGRIVQVEEVSMLYRGSTLTGDPKDNMSSKPLLLFSKQTTEAPRAPSSRKSARVPVGVEIDARSLDKTVLKELGLLGGGTDAARNNAANSGDSMFNSPSFTEDMQTTAAGLKQQSFYRQPHPVTIRAYRIKEEVPRFQQVAVDLPAEEYIRPGWYGDVWHPSKIGTAYNTFFGTGAITDPHTVSGPPTAARDAVAEAMETNDPNDPRKDAPVVYQLENGASIEQAVAFLQATYSQIKQQGLDVEEFIRAYTYRPIATMTDLFGTRDLALSADGAYVLSGVEGFHSRAFGNFNDLFGLVTPDIVSVVGLKRGTTSAQKGDTRKVKRDAVLDYLAGLGLGRAIIG